MTKSPFTTGKPRCLRFPLTLLRAGRGLLSGGIGLRKTTLLRRLGIEARTWRGDAGTGCALPPSFQEDRLLPWLTVRDNLAVPLRGEKAAAAVEKALRLVGLEHAGELYPDELSGGMRPRGHRPRAGLRRGCWCWTKPFTGIDEARWQELACLPRKEYEEKLILLVTHVRAEWEAFEAKTYALRRALSGRWE